MRARRRALIHFEFIQGAGEGSIKYSDICAGPDGLLYCSPFNASSVLVIDPCARTLSFIEGAEEGGLKYFGICAGPDGMLYCAATAASSVLVIDPRTQTLSFIEGAVGSGLKWSGICAGPAGRLYCAPFLSSCDGLRAGAMCWQGACEGDAREDRRRGPEAVAQIGGTCAAKDSLLH